jgi:FKBP-type peptidyl-prolyl cis-trans isomerase
MKINKVTLTLLITLFLLSGCNNSQYSAPDVSEIDKKLENGKKLGNATITNDITAPANKNENSRPDDPSNINIKKNVNLKQPQKGDNSLMGKSQQTQDQLSTVNELLIVDDVKGTGEEAVAGKEITVHYTGKLTNGEVFDSSLSRNQPFKFILGAGQVIQGWDQGFVGMKVGGKRRLTIPANLAYGNRAVGSIPAGATLIFDVELLGVGDVQ